MQISRKQKGFLAALTLAFGAVSMTAFGSVSGTEPAESAADDLNVSNTEQAAGGYLEAAAAAVLPEDASVLITVEGSGLTATVTAYVKEAAEADKEQQENNAEVQENQADRSKTGPGIALLERDAASQEKADGNTEASVEQNDAAQSVWRAVIRTEEGRLGRRGLGKTQEGDQKTPVGFFKMNTPFGIAAAEEGFPENYLQVTGDLYWNGDSASDRYNELVSTNTYNAFDKAKSEHLIDYAGYYDYAIDMGYNPEGTPRLGSALFLHCSVNGQNTGGCVAIPRDVMSAVMKLYQEGKTYIAVAPAGSLSAVLPARS